MKITKNKVVGIDYTLKDNDGEVLDSSEEGHPLYYLHGAGNLIPGLENSLEGKSAGEHLQVTVQPAEGYGERDETLRQQVPRDRFRGVDELQIGMRFRVAGHDGEQLVVSVVEIADDNVTIDGNHSLAGVTLNFDVTVREVRDATKDELAHSHAHGPGGHHH